MHRADDGDPFHGTRPGALLATACLLAVLLIGLNLAKPLHIDDPFIGEIAGRVLEHPGDPYGFEIFWLQWPQPVYEELTPPLVPYWWALGLLLVGAQTWAIKLWFAPFVVALAVGMLALLRRVAPAGGAPFLVLALLSPAVAPSVNLMQDVPAYGLALCGVATYLAAAATAGRRGDGLAIVAGLLLGLALQTKYPVATFVAAVALHGLLLRRWRRAALAVVVALLLFGAWELYTGRAYGQGMFAGQLTNSMYWVPRSAMAASLLRLLGGTLAATAVAGALALGVRRTAVPAAAGLLLAGYASLAVAPWSSTFYLVLGVAVVAVLGAGAWRLAVMPGYREPGARQGRLVSCWLVLWLVGELAGVFVTAPFPAVRRVIGPVLVATLLVARLWTISAVARQRTARRALVAVAWVGGALGLLHVVVDTLEARAQRDAVTAAVVAIASTGSAADGTTIWYAGHWGFREHARRAGWRPVIPDHSLLEPGDWLVVPDRVERQAFRLRGGDARPRFEIELPTILPLATGRGFYSGDRPLSHLHGARLGLTVAQLSAPSHVETDWPTRRLTNFVLRSPALTSRAAYPALAAHMSGATAAGDRRLAADVLAQVAAPGDDALIRPFTVALDDRDPFVRRRAVDGLGAIGPDAAAREALERAAEHDPSPEVRGAAASALRRERKRGDGAR